MAHQAYACFAFFLFFVKMLLEAYFLNAFVVIDHKGIPISMIFCVFARQIIIA